MSTTPPPHLARAARSAASPLLELLVVMVIIGLLAGIVAPQYFSQIGKSNTKVARAQIEALGQALDQYRLDTAATRPASRTWPRCAARRAAKPLERPHLKRDVPQDPRGHAYQYRSPGQHGDYDLLSLGSDGQPGGDGESADIVSW